MIPLAKRLLNAFLHDDGAVTGWIRGFFLFCAAGGIGFANEAADIIGSPSMAKIIKIMAIICGFIGGAIRAGEKNITTQEPGTSIDVGLETKIEVTKTPEVPGG